MVKFCPKCEKILKRVKKGSDMVFLCSSCGYEEEAGDAVGGKSVKLDKKKTEKKMALNKTLVFDQHAEAGILPKTKVTCPKCGHGEAEYFQLQTRSADEPATTFYTCLNLSCRHKWREY
jgi:DNA-directed RNA polymerase subunit M